MEKLVWLAPRVCFSIQLLAIAVSAREQQFAALGDFKLRSGEMIRDCRIGYRTFGHLNDQKSNVIVARFDHVVTRQPALEFARHLHARTLELDSDCDHLAPFCEGEKVNRLVAEFLKSN
jgi:homoserine acetyltransferase